MTFRRPLTPQWTISFLYNTYEPLGSARHFLRKMAYRDSIKPVRTYPTDMMIKKIRVLRMLKDLSEPGRSMAKAKTGTFTITDEILVNGALTNSAIAIGSLIDVGDAQALEIESVDYTFQHFNGSSYGPVHGTTAPFTGDAAIQVQLLDKSVTVGQSNADNNVISSAQYHYDASTGGPTYPGSDFYPDDFKNTTGRFVVNDELYVFIQGSGAYQTSQYLAVSVRIRAKVVKLSTRDWMAISLETVQNE